MFSCRCASIALLHRFIPTFWDLAIKQYPGHIQDTTPVLPDPPLIYVESKHVLPKIVATESDFAKLRHDVTPECGEET